VGRTRRCKGCRCTAYGTEHLARPDGRWRGAGSSRARDGAQLDGVRRGQLPGCVVAPGACRSLFHASRCACLPRSRGACSRACRPAAADEGFEDESSATPTLLSAGTGASVPDGGPGAASSADCVAALVPEPAPTPAPEPVPEPVDEPVDAGAPAAAGLEPGAGQDTAAPGTLAAELPAWAVSELRAAEEAKQELLRVRKELEQAKTQLQAAACQQTREEEAELARKLVGFYAAHKVTKTHEIPKIAKDFVGRESELNKVLRLKYGKDLDTFQSEKAAGTLAGLEGAASRKSPVASTVQTRKQSVSPPSARPPAPRAPNRPSSAMGSRPHVAKKEVRIDECVLLAGGFGNGDDALVH